MKGNEKIDDILKDVSQKSGYEVPSSYFNHLEKNILEKVKEPKIDIWNRGAVAKYAAVLFLLVSATALFFRVNSHSSEPHSAINENVNNESWDSEAEGNGLVTSVDESDETDLLTDLYIEYLIENDIDIDAIVEVY